MREFDLLHHVFAANAALPPRVTIPPGDDMGALNLTGGADVLVTVDQVADGVHYDLAATPITQVARKSITRNLSDVAAMACRPLGAVAAVCLPRSFTQARATELFDAMRATAGAYDCPLFGGDVSVWDGKLIITVTLLAQPWNAQTPPILRSGAKAGDVVCVTGRLGGSLETLDGRTHHLDFEPRVNLARKLAENPLTRPTAMIDLSDGLARDLGHICVMSGVGAEIVADQLPVTRAAHALSHRDHQPVWHHALADGEDYELCFTLAADRAERHLPAEIDGVPLTRVGIIHPKTSTNRPAIRLPDGSIQPLEDLGWEHTTSA